MDRVPPSAIAVTPLGIVSIGSITYPCRPYHVGQPTQRHVPQHSRLLGRIGCGRIETQTEGQAGGLYAFGTALQLYYHINYRPIDGHHTIKFAGDLVFYIRGFVNYGGSSVL